MFIRRLLVGLISLSLAYAPIAIAQETPIYPGWSKIIDPVSGHPAWVSPKTVSSLSHSVGATIWESALSSRGAGGATFTNTAKLAISGAEVAVVTKGAVSAASAFLGVRTLAGAIIGGPPGVAFGLITLAPEIIDYFYTDKSGLGPLSDRESDKPFYKIEDRSSTEYTFDGVHWAMSKSSACQAWPAVSGGYNKLEDIYCIKYNSTNGYVTSGTANERISTSGKEIPASWSDIAPYMDAPSKIIKPEAIQTLLRLGIKVPVVYPLDDPSFFAPGVSSISGPSSIPGSPLSSTTETPEKITTTTKTPQTDLKYGSTKDPVTGKPTPSVTAKPGEKVVTTETDKATGVTKIVSTTTTETPSPATPTNSTPSETPDLCALHPEIVACATVDEVDMCKKYPDSLACQETDEPEVPDLEELEKPITFTPDGGWGGSSGSCPAPRHLSSGTGADFSFTPYCDFMTALRPVFVGVAWLSGAMILIGANRKE